MNFPGAYGASKIGVTTVVAFLAATSGTIRVTDSPAGGTFSLYAEVDCYVRQGAAAIVATTAGTYIAAGSYYPLTIESILDQYLAVIGGGVAGNLRITRISQVN